LIYLVIFVNIIFILQRLDRLLIVYNRWSNSGYEGSL